MFAAAQGGDHEDGRATFGHSLVVDPWGRVIAEGGTEPGVVFADIDPAEVVHGTRAHSLAAARPALRDPRADGRADAPACGRRRRVIRYNLVCDKRHEFESWFPNSAAYDKQAKRGLVSCPLCGSAKVEKAIMAPRLARKDKSTPDHGAGRGGRAATLPPRRRPRSR